MKLKIIIPILIVLILVIVTFYFQSQSAPQTPVENNNGEETIPDDTVLKSIYDGTYTGTFNYEYQDKDRFSGKVINPWTPGFFTLTLTFKTLSISNDPDDPTVSLDVTNAIVSDPSFGTGVGGVDPVGSFGVSYSASLPANPAERGTSKNNYMTLYFNLEGDYETKMIEIKSGTIKLSPDGKTLSNDPDWRDNFPGISFGANVPIWEAKTPGTTTTFRSGGAYGKSGVYDRSFKYGSWTLTKISP